MLFTSLLLFRLLPARRARAIFLMAYVQYRYIRTYYTTWWRLLVFLRGEAGDLALVSTPVIRSQTVSTAVLNAVNTMLVQIFAREQNQIWSSMPLR